MSEQSAWGRAIAWVETLEKGLTYIVDAVLMVLLWLALVPLRWRDVRLRKYNQVSSAAPAHPVALTQAEMLFKIEREDSAATDDKTRLLLTLTTSLATLALVFGGYVRPRWLFVVLVGLLVASVLLCLSVFEVRRGMMLPTPEDSSSEDRSSDWARDLMLSYYANRATHAFRVDRYPAMQAEDSLMGSSGGGGQQTAQRWGLPTTVPRVSPSPLATGGHQCHNGRRGRRPKC